MWFPTPSAESIIIVIPERIHIASLPRSAHWHLSIIHKLSARLVQDNSCNYEYFSHQLLFVCDAIKFALYHPQAHNTHSIDKLCGAHWPAQSCYFAPLLAGTAWAYDDYDNCEVGKSLTVEDSLTIANRDVRVVTAARYRGRNVREKYEKSQRESFEML